MTLKRRTVLKSGFAFSALSLASINFANASEDKTWVKRIPSSGEIIPAVGLGSWITFNVGNDKVLMDECAAVIDAFFKSGGTMIDSSPMYGSAQQTIGYSLEKLAATGKVFSADKVWTSSDEAPSQLQATQEFWGVPKFDLMQVHNLVDWQKNLEMLIAMKDAGKLRYVGITTSHGRRHKDLEKIIANEPIDFVQLTYNIEDRDVEERLLPLAQEKGIAVIANRPFQRGGLISATSRKPLPEWAKVETGTENWAQFLLKFVISHPAVTCAIPATSNVDHVVENMNVAKGTLPDAKTRQKMTDYFKEI